MSADPTAPETLQRYEFQRIRMGIPVRISLYATDDATAKQAAQAALARMKQLDRILSDYDPDSELMQLCNQAGTDRQVPVFGRPQSGAGAFVTRFPADGGSFRHHRGAAGQAVAQSEAKEATPNG